MTVFLHISSAVIKSEYDYPKSTVVKTVFSLWKHKTLQVTLQGGSNKKITLQCKSYPYRPQLTIKLKKKTTKLFFSPRVMAKSMVQSIYLRMLLL